VTNWTQLLPLWLERLGASIVAFKNVYCAYARHLWEVRSILETFSISLADAEGRMGNRTPLVNSSTWLVVPSTPCTSAPSGYTRSQSEVLRLWEECHDAHVQSDSEPRDSRGKQSARGVMPRYGQK